MYPCLLSYHCVCTISPLLKSLTLLGAPRRFFILFRFISMSTKLFAAPNARVACPFVPPVSLPITPRSMTATYCEPSARVFRTCPLFCTPVSGFRNRVILWFLSALHCVPTHKIPLFPAVGRVRLCPFYAWQLDPAAMVDQCPNAPVSSAIDHSLSLLSSLDPKSSSTKKLLRSERAAMTSCRLHITAATQDSLMPGNCYNEYKRIPARESCQCAAAFRPLMPLMSKFMSSFLLSDVPESCRLGLHALPLSLG
jgi:hypothetical protein